MYDKFAQLCAAKGVSVTKATEEIGLARTIATKWKKTGATPRGDTLKKIAAYFGVSESYLLKDEKNQPADDDDDELMEEFQILRDKPELRVLLFAGKHLTAEQINRFAETMKSIPEG